MQTGRMKATIVVLRECRRNVMRRFFFVKVQICENSTILAGVEGFVAAPRCYKGGCQVVRTTAIMLRRIVTLRNRDRYMKWSRRRESKPQEAAQLGVFL